MVPLRIDPCEAAPVHEERFRRPRLVLQDVSQSPAPRVSHSRRPQPLRRWESLLFTVAAVAVLTFFLAGSALSLWHAAQISDNGRFVAMTPTVAVTIAPGDTLWKYAARYGASDKYMLERVAAIARDNHLSPDAALVPGQRLRVAVENPVELAKLSRQHRLSVASATR